MHFVKKKKLNLFSVHEIKGETIEYLTLTKIPILQHLKGLKNPKGFMRHTVHCNPRNVCKKTVLNTIEFEKNDMTQNENYGKK